MIPGWARAGLAGWRQAGGRLEGDHLRIYSFLADRAAWELSWRQAGGRLEAGWRQAGGRLEEVLNLGDCVDGMHHRFCAPEMLGEQVQGAKVTVPSAHTTSDKCQY